MDLEDSHLSRHTHKRAPRGQTRSRRGYAVTGIHLEQIDDIVTHSDTRTGPVLCISWPGEDPLSVL